MYGSSLMFRVVYSLIIAVCLGAAQLSSAEIFIAPGFSPSGTLSVTNGGTYRVGIVMSIRTPSEIVSAYDLDVLYNQSILNLTSISFGSALGTYTGDLGTTEVLQRSNFANGVANLKAVSLLSDLDLFARQDGMGGNILLATVTFTGTGTGTDTLAYAWGLTSSGLRDVKGAANTAYSVVPEPSTYLLSLIAGSGVAATVWFSRRRSRRSLS
jgi:PEP-CTERM motif